MKPTLLTLLDRTPPFICRVMAKHNGKRKTIAELSKASGIPRRTIVYLFYQPSWRGMKVETASRLSAACDVELWSKNPMAKFLRSKHDPDYLTKAQKEACERAKGKKNEKGQR